MPSLPELVASVPSGSAYVRLMRDEVCYLGGPYPSRKLACESAGRLVCDVPHVTSISILGRPRVAAPRYDGRWYARATFLADGYTAVVGPFGSWRQARTDLMELADRGQIGGWHEWKIDYHEVADEPAPMWSRPGQWHDASTTPSSGFARNGSRITGWIAAGGRPDTSRDDLLRDLVTLWDEWPAEGVEWDVLATVLATMASPSRVAADEAGAVADALLELATAVDERAGAGPGAAEDILRLVRALRPNGAEPQAPA